MMATNLGVNNKDEYYRKKITKGKRLRGQKRDIMSEEQNV